MKAVVIESGSRANCMVVSNIDRNIVIDCGLSAETALNLMAECDIYRSQIDAVLVTHEHGDHAKGVAKLCYKTGAFLVASTGTADAIGMTGARSEWPVRVAGFEIDCFPVPHDCKDPCGFVVRQGDKSIGYVTDAGYVTKHMVEKLIGVNCIFIEANHDPRMLRRSEVKHSSVKRRVESGHGHLSNEVAGKLVAELAKHGLERAVLMHLSKDSNTPELAMQVVKQLSPTTDVQVATFGLEVAI